MEVLLKKNCVPYWLKYSSIIVQTKPNFVSGLPFFDMLALWKPTQYIGSTLLASGRSERNLVFCFMASISFISASSE